MGAVASVARQRLSGRGRALLVAGVLLGLGFGLALASATAARHTASAYGRVLAAADAEDATLSHGLSPEEADERLAGVDGIVEHRYQAGFLGFVDGVDPALTPGFLAGVDARSFGELPHLIAGRLPDPDRADEVLVNDYLAEEAGLDVGQEIVINLVDLEGSQPRRQPATIVGVGLFPREAVVDETEQFGIVSLTDAFHDAHADLRLYANSLISAAPGFDVRRDIAPVVGDRGFALEEVRAQEIEEVGDTLRPLVTLLVAFAVLAFIATAVAAGQIIQRDHERRRADDETLTVLGMVRHQVLLAHLVTSGLIAVVAACTAAAVVVAASPVAPVGPLHQLDPGQGVVVDWSVLVVGTAAILATMVAITAGFVLLGGRGAARVEPTTAAALPTMARRAEAVAGLTLALRRAGGRERTWRGGLFAAAAVALSAAVTTLVVSAVRLSDTPERYGVDWDLTAVNAFGDQSEEALTATFGGGDVVAATGFTSASFLVNGQAVPGLAATPIKGDLGPTLLRGAQVRADDEIVLGQDTLESLGADVGDTVTVEASGEGFADEAAGRRVELQVVGVATFPAIVQQGLDSARLGSGALVTRATFERLGGSPDNDPEWTAVRLADGVDPATVIARNPEGIPNPFQIPTSWYTDAKPAELRQLDSVRSLLVAAVVVGYLIVLAVVTHALWSQARRNRRGRAVLQALGFTRRQLGEVAAWQAVPLTLIAVVVGIPLGIALGRWGSSLFARSLAVVDRATVSVPVVGALVVAVLTAVAVGALTSLAVARHTRPAALLREE